MQVCADAAASGLDELAERLESVRLARDGKVDDVGGAEAVAIEEALDALDRSEMAYAGLIPVEGSMPVELLLGVDHDEENRPCGGGEPDGLDGPEVDVGALIGHSGRL